MTFEEWNGQLEKWIEEINNLIGRTDLATPEDEESFPQTHNLCTEDAIINYAKGIGDTNPLYTDPEYAKKSCYGHMIAPQGRFLEYFGATGSFPMGNIPRGVNRLYGGTKYEFFRNMTPGDVISVKDEFLGLKEKKVENKPYRLFTMESKRDYLNGNGELICSTVGNLIITAKMPKEKSQDATKAEKEFPVRTPYEEAYLEQIRKHYDDLLEHKGIQGATPRYYEDVSVGENIGQLIKGPIDIIDQVSFSVATGNNPGAAAAKWRALRNDCIFKNKETGDYIKRIAWHFSDDVAHMAGLPFAMVFGAMNEANLGHLITNWMGDRGFIKHLECQHRGAAFVGDVLIVSGKVIEKYEEGNEGLVRLEINSTKSDGSVVTPGTAVVRLPKKA